ncbi:MAG: hypothetical protein ACD_75C01492G0004 [uncultured bacterium]|nr:MAG: hypothetical protein ACD_75C01492G0004 [uncultured bacterium]
MVAGDRDRIEVFHLLVDEVFLNVAHHLQGEFDREDAGVLTLILFQDIGLDGAPHIGEDACFDLFILAVFRTAVVFGDEFFHLLVDGGVHEHRQNDRRRSIDGHRYRGGGGAEIEAAIEYFDVVEGADAYPRGADLAVDIRADRRVPAVQGHRIEGGGQPFRLIISREQPEPFIGLGRPAFPGKHPGRILAGPLHRKYPAGIGEIARQVFLAQPGIDIGRIGEFRQGDFADFRVRQRFGKERHADLPVAHGVDQLVAGIIGAGFFPAPQ